MSERVASLFGVDPIASQREYRDVAGIDTVFTEHEGGGRTGFVRSYALNRALPRRLQEALDLPGQPESSFFVVEEEDGRVATGTPRRKGSARRSPPKSPPSGTR